MDTSAANTAAATAATNTASAGVPADAATEKKRREDKTRILATRAELDALTPEEGYKRFIIKCPDSIGGGEIFVVAREQQRALGVGAASKGFTAEDMDRKAPGRKPGRTVEDEIAAMTPEARRAIFAKYMAEAGGPAATTGTPAVAATGTTHRGDVAPGKPDGAPTTPKPGAATPAAAKGTNPIRK